MPRDIIQTDRPSDFVKLAKTLGYDTLCVLSSQQKKDEIIDGIRIIWIRIMEPAKFLAGKHNEKIAIQSSPSDRGVLERTPFLLYNLETSERKDAHHFRSSGLNHITCKLAGKTRIGLSLSLMHLARRAHKPEIVGRIIQNIRLCRKYNVRMVAGSFATEPIDMRSPHDVAALLRVLGMNADQAKDAQELR